ncbi:hypothetical protein Hdeb2414_s0002g00067351 [Helianthus debilis subsp. tardiflorus]
MFDVLFSYYKYEIRCGWVELLCYLLVQLITSWALGIFRYRSFFALFRVMNM